MLVKTLPVGQLETNCYVVTNENSLECFIVDPGDEANRILDYIESNRLKLQAILLTHGHFDHIGAVNSIVEETGVPCYLHELDCAREGEISFNQFRLPQGGRHYADGDELEIAGMTVKVIGTPGHTPGGVSLLCGDALFSGDTLFRGSLGRCDLPGGDIEQELLSLKKLCSLPGNYEVYPGHMDSTSLQRERSFNYYCRVAMEM